MCGLLFPKCVLAQVPGHDVFDTWGMFASMPSQITAEWSLDALSPKPEHPKQTRPMTSKCVLVSICDKEYKKHMHVYMLRPRTPFSYFREVRDKEGPKKHRRQVTGRSSESRGSCSSAKGSCGCFFLSKSQNSSSTGGSFSPDRCSVLIPAKKTIS